MRRTRRIRTVERPPQGMPCSIFPTSTSATFKAIMPAQAPPKCAVPLHIIPRIRAKAITLPKEPHSLTPFPLIVCRAPIGDCAAATGTKARAMHRRSAPSDDRIDSRRIDFTTETLLAAQHRNQRRSSEYAGAGRVMVCLTRARLHTTKRGWQRTVGARWWCVGRAE
jgi:hypothetical protein